LSQLIGFLLLLVILFTFVQLFVRLVGWFVKKFIPSINSAYECFIERLVNLVSSKHKEENHKLREKKVRELVSSLGVGLLVAFIIHTHYFSHLPVVRDIEDASLDLVMAINEGSLPSKKEEKKPQFVILDIDEETHKDWNYPPFTPRNHLKTLIDTAIQGKPQLVIVDVDLSQEAPFNELKNLSKWRVLGENERELEKFAKTFERHPFDQELYDYIYTYKEMKNCNSQENGQPKCVPIIFLGPHLERMEKGDFGKISKISFLERAVSKSMPYVQWAPAIFLQKTPEQVVRRWPLWQPICMKDGQADEKVVPSMGLLVASLFSNGFVESEQKIKQFSDWYKPSREECTGQKEYIRSTFSDNPDTLKTEPDTIKIGKLNINPDKDSSERIIYSIPWLKDHQQPPELPYKFPNSGCRTIEKDECILEIKKAGDFVQVNPYGTVQPDLEVLNGKIVIIGGSYQYDGKGDIHLTSLGKMSGALLIVNAIYSLLQFEVKPLGLGWVLVMDAIIILCMSVMMMSRWFFWPVAGLCVAVFIYLFKSVWPEVEVSTVSFFFLVVLLTGITAWLFPFVRLVLSTIIFIFVLALASVYVFEDGTWLEFAIPLMAVLFHQISDAVECCEHCHKLT